MYSESDILIFVVLSETIRCIREWLVIAEGQKRGEYLGKMSDDEKMIKKWVLSVIVVQRERRMDGRTMGRSNVLSQID